MGPPVALDDGQDGLLFVGQLLAHPGPRHMPKSYTDPRHPVKRSGEHLNSIPRIPKKYAGILSARSPERPGNAWVYAIA
ncbi:MAG: hypothetical protein SangKO_066450 [Sandaracinaceae bacterium]